MKKLLLLLALVLSCGLASFADEMSFDINSTTLGNTSGSYLTNAFSFTVENTTFQVNNINPTTGQARGNKSNAANNFFIYNTTGIDNISSIEITYSGTIDATKVYLAVGDEACSSVITTGTNGTASNNVLKIDALDATKSFFRLQFINKSTSGIVKISKIAITYGSGSVKSPAGLEYTETEFNVELGNEFTAPELVNPNDLAVTYTSSDESVATVAADGSVEILAAGTTTITATSAETETYQKGEASYKLTVTRPIPEGAIVEELTAADFAITSNYKDYTWTSSVTGIKYVAHAYSESGEYFQLRTKNSQSGIVVTQNDNGYLLSNIEVEWVVPGMAGTTLDVYVNDEAYSAPSALFSTATQGNKVGSIVKTENAPLSLNADKKFVGIRSNDGAVQLSKITLIWEKPAAPVAPAAPVVTMGEKTVTVTVEEGCTAYYKFVVVNDQPAIETFALEADTWYPVENNTIDLTKLPMTSGNEKLQLTVKAVNADNVESEVYTTEPFANPGGTTGIADIELGEEAPAEYYNLQGVRMEGELTPGLYIRRQGNKATKVIVK